MKKLTNFIVNKGTIKRAKYIYLPFVIILCAFLFLAAQITVKKGKSFAEIDQDFHKNIPIVYTPHYNIEFFGLEEFHHFDSKKYGRIYDILKEQGVDTNSFIAGQKADNKLLLLHHTQAYLDSLNSSWELARITELGFLRFFPRKLARNVVLEPMLYQTGGSIIAAKAALEHGWSINLGGGFHHASSENGEGFCALADIGLIIKYLRAKKLIQKAMIIDLDAHQGNGHERDFLEDDDVYIFDIYNKDVYPREHAVKHAINKKVELPIYAGDKLYNSNFIPAIQQAFSEFKPDIIIYVAGTDILDGDPLGGLGVSAQGVLERDELVFKYAFDHKIPIVMLLSGGYQKSNASIIAKSITNLNEKYGLLNK
ncbi:MAG: histone deacetylase [Micavibrio sp.]|nr:histone deacetylase [Micavibrio sp.]